MPLLLNPSTLTWGVAKVRVARVAGGKGDPDWEALAKECITSALQLFELARDWKWLYVSAAPITIVANTSTYTLPAAFRKPYSARVGTRYLTYMPQGLWDIINPQNIGSGPLAYSLFNAHDTGKVELLPPIGDAPASDPLHIRYLRKVTDTDSDGNTLDVPKAYEDGIISLARAKLLLERGGEDTRMQTFYQEYNRALDQATKDDQRMPNIDEGFIPQSGIPIDAAWNPNSLSLAEGYWDRD